jgi:hypothetical protein
VQRVIPNAPNPNPKPNLTLTLFPQSQKNVTKKACLALALWFVFFFVVCLRPFSSSLSIRFVLVGTSCWLGVVVPESTEKKIHHPPACSPFDFDLEILK